MIGPFPEESISQSPPGGHNNSGGTGQEREVEAKGIAANGLLGAVKSDCRTSPARPWSATHHSTSVAMREHAQFI
jgi:hypothetical protein